MRKDTLMKMIEFAQSLAKSGDAFHKEMCADARTLAKDMRLGPQHRCKGRGPYGVELSFPACVAISTAAFTVTSGRATHAKRVLDVIANPKLAADATTIAHPRGNAVRKGASAWKGALDSAQLSPWPGHDELHAVYQKHVVKTGNLAWSTLMPVKLYVTLRGFTDEQVNCYIPPMGRAVRDGMAHLLGAAFRESPKGHRDSYDLHRHLALLAESNVMAVNSGFWVDGV